MTMAFIIIILAVLLSLVNRKYGSVNVTPVFAQIPFAKIIWGNSTSFIELWNAIIAQKDDCSHVANKEETEFSFRRLT